MKAFAALLGDVRVIPVVVIDSPRSAEPLAAARADAGLPCAEVTLRTPAALEALHAMTDPTSSDSPDRVSNDSQTVCRRFESSRGHHLPRSAA